MSTLQSIEHIVFQTDHASVLVRQFPVMAGYLGKCMAAKVMKAWDERP